MDKMLVVDGKVVKPIVKKLRSMQQEINDAQLAAVEARLKTLPKDADEERKALAEAVLFIKGKKMPGEKEIRSALVNNLIVPVKSIRAQGLTIADILCAKNIVEKIEVLESKNSVVLKEEEYKLLKESFEKFTWPVDDFQVEGVTAAYGIMESASDAQKDE